MHRIQTQYIKFTFSKVLILGNQASHNFASKLNKTNVVPFEDFLHIMVRIEMQ